MKYLLLLIFLPTLLLSQSNAEVGYVIRITASSGVFKETAIGFDDSQQTDLIFVVMRYN